MTTFADQELRASVARLLALRKAVEADVHAAHTGRALISTETQRKQDRDLRRDLKAALDDASVVLHHGDRDAAEPTTPPVADPGPSLADQLACVRREIGYRAGCYPRWVAGQKMTQAKADHELAAMRAVLETLEASAATPPPPAKTGGL
jgi:hypothetical protein